MLSKAIELTPENLFKRLGRSDQPVLLDLCLEEDFNQDPYLIPTAHRVHHGDILDEVPHLIGRDCVVICQKGLKIIQGGAALLRCEGIKAVHLMGGMVAWRAQGWPAIPFKTLTTLPQKGKRWAMGDCPTVQEWACA